MCISARMYVCAGGGYPLPIQERAKIGIISERSQAHNCSLHLQEPLTR